MVRTFGPEDLSSTRKTVVEVEIHALVDLRHRPEPPEERTALWSGRNRLAARRPPPRLHPEQRAESGLVTLRTGGLMTLQTGGPVTLRTGGIEARLQRSLDEEVTLEGHD